MFGDDYMKTLVSLLLIGVLVISASRFCTRGIAAAEDKAAAVKVSVADVGTKVELIGRLGPPLGTMMTVQGRWGYPDQSHGPTKDYALLFTATHVNGAKLAKPAVFRVGRVTACDKQGKDVIPPYEQHKRLDGVSWTLRAYETGRFTRTPGEFWEELGQVIPASPYADRFASELVGVLQPK
jgi:hypothetical protein